MTFWERAAAEHRLWMAAPAAERGPDPLELRDAHWECPHDNLPGDAVIDCGCWDTDTAPSQGV